MSKKYEGICEQHKYVNQQYMETLLFGKNHLQEVSCLSTV